MERKVDGYAPSPEAVDELRLPAGEGLVARRALTAEELELALSENIPGLHVDPDMVVTTPLHEAAEAGEDFLVRALIMMGADVNAKGEDGETPVHCAAMYGNLECLSLLLKAGANPNAQNEEGESPLHEAVREGDLPCMDALLKAGADVDAKDSGSHTALHIACLAGDVKVVNFLIEAGANTLEKDDAGNTVLHLASYKGHDAVVELLLDCCPELLRTRSCDDLSSLDVSESRGHQGVQKLLRSASMKQFDQGQW